MDWWLASFFLGAIFSLFLPIVPDLFVLISLLSCAIICFGFSLTISNTTPKTFRSISGALVGASWMLFNAFYFQHTWQVNELNATALSTKAQWIQGSIISLHSYENENNLTKRLPANNTLRFNINVTHINKIELNKSINLRLSWKSAALAITQGEIVKLKVKFKPAQGLANLGSFSYQTWLNSKRISATGYVLNHKDNKVLLFENTLRQKLFTNYKNLLPDHELSPLLIALGFGSRSDLNKTLWHVLQTTGTGHLIAISGLHIGLVATGGFFIVMLLTRLMPLNFFRHSNTLQTINIRYYGIALSLLLAISYGYLAGFSLPTIRALVMLIIYWCVRLLGIKLSIKRWLLMTLFVITLTTPFSLFTASFWLSVYAVTIIFLTLWRFKSQLAVGSSLWRFVKGLIIIQISLTLMLLPVSAVFFQQVSVVALLANIFAVPWMSFISIPLCLLSVLLMPVSEVLSQYVSTLCLASLEVLWHYLTYLSSKSWAIIALSGLNVQLLVLCGFLAAIFLFFQPILKVNAKYIVTLCCSFFIALLVLIFDHKTNQKSQEWKLVVFDVGQGLSILIQRQHHAILYDTGALYSSGFNMIEAVVLPYLQHESITSLDKVIISHSDNDHAGGLTVLAQSIKIDTLIYNAKKQNEHVEKISGCVQGKSLYWQGLTFEMLWPKESVSKENDDSCVILIRKGVHSVLLTGDISKKVEKRLIKQFPQLRADVLIVPHHGSKTSSSNAFVAAIKPDIAIVSAGFLNRWHMPVTEVVKRYDEEGIKLLNTANSGQIILNFSEKEIEQQTFHNNLWPFWFANSP
jgi:competence protein ComEC